MSRSAAIDKPFEQRLPARIGLALQRFGVALDANQKVSIIALNGLHDAIKGPGSIRMQPWRNRFERLMVK